MLTGPHAYLWVKTAHIVLVTAWLAGLFYLPRIFEHQRRKLLRRRQDAAAEEAGAEQDETGE